MKVSEFIRELTQLPQDYDISICGIEDFAYCINKKLNIVLIDEESPVDEYCENGDYERIYIECDDKSMIYEWCKSEPEVVKLFIKNLEIKKCGNIDETIKIFNTCKNSSLSFHMNFVYGEIKLMYLVRHIYIFNDYEELPENENNTWIELSDSINGEKIYRHTQYKEIFKHVNINNKQIYYTCDELKIHCNDDNFSYFISPINIETDKNVFINEYPEKIFTRHTEIINLQ